MTPRAPFRVWVAEIATSSLVRLGEILGDDGGGCGDISGICYRINGLMDGRGDADREKGSLASGVVDGMREEESAAAKSCGFGRRVARLGDDFSSLSVRRLYAADEACPRLGARREIYLVSSLTSSPFQISVLLHGEMDDEEDGGTVNGSSIVGGSGVCDAARSCVCGVAAGVICFITFVCLQSCCHAHPPDEAFAVTTAYRR